MTDATSETLQPGSQATLEPHCTVEGLKRHAKLLRSKLGPHKTIKLSHAQIAVVRCIGRAANTVFSRREPPSPVFPPHVLESEREDYQRYREIATLTEMFPQIELTAIIEFVSSWHLIDWKEVAPEDSARRKPSAPEEGLSFAAGLRRAAMGMTASRVLPHDIDYQEVSLSTAATPAPPERFMPPSVDFASEKAVALAEITGSCTLAAAYYITAQIFGFANWAELEKSFRLASRSQFDEELCADAFAQRRKWQIELLSALFSTDRLSAVELRSFWKPTSSSMTYANHIWWSGPDRSNAQTETKNAARIGGKLSVKPRTGTKAGNENR
jgi:hypothetical protein